MATVPSGCEIRVAMFGGSNNDQRILGSLIAGGEDFSTSPQGTGRWTRKPFLCVETPDLGSPSMHEKQLEIQKCVAHCDPGPNVLLILINPQGFQELNMTRLRFHLQSFGKNVFNFCMVIITGRTRSAWHPAIDQLMLQCDGRHYTVHLDNKSFFENNLDELRETMASIVSYNGSRHLTFKCQNNGLKKPVSNIILCGRTRTTRASVIQAMVGERVDLPEDAMFFIEKQEMFGQLVTLAELDSLHGRRQDIAKQKSVDSISLCGHKGAHAFLLVMALERLSEQDTSEFKAILAAFGDRAERFILPVITVKSDVTEDVRMFLKENAVYQKIVRRCGGRQVLLNTKRREQVAEVLQSVETMQAGSPLGFTESMFEPERSFQRGAFISFKGRKKTTNSIRCSLKVRARSEGIPLRKQGMMGNRIPNNEAQSSASEVQCCRGSCGPESQSGDNSLRLVLVGKTGSGKSSTANNILGEACFKSGSSFGSVSEHCQEARAVVNGRQVVVIDTPGLYDTHFSEEQMHAEILKSVKYSHPGPHAFIVVLAIGRFTEEEKKTIELLNFIFGQRAQAFSIVVFTRGDQLEDMTIEECIEEERSGVLRKLISQCGGRYHVMNNKDKKNRDQVYELLDKVETMVRENGGSCYEAEGDSEEEEVEAEETLELDPHIEEMGVKRRSIKELIQKIEVEHEESARKMLDTRDKIEKERKKIEQQNKMREAENREIREKEMKQRGSFKRKMQALSMELQRCEDGSMPGGRFMSLKQTREEWDRHQDRLDQGRREWWEKQDQADKQDEEEIDELSKTYEEKLERYETKRQEDTDRIRRLQRDLREIERKHQELMEQMQRRHNAEAKREAHECGEFREKYDQDVRREKEKYTKQMNDIKQKQWKQTDFLVKQLCKNKNFEKRYKRLEQRQEEEIEGFKRQRNSQNFDDISNHIKEVLKKHEEDNNALIMDYISTSTNARCVIL